VSGLARSEKSFPDEESGIDPAMFAAVMPRLTHEALYCYVARPTDAGCGMTFA